MLNRAAAASVVIWPVLSLASLAVGWAAQASNPNGAPSLRSFDDNGRLDSLETYINGQRFQDVSPLLESYLKDHPQSWRAHYDLGYVEFRTHHISDSVKELSKSLSLNVNNAEAHKILALDCNIVGRYDLAEVELEQAKRLKPDSAEIRYLLGRMYYTKGVYPAAKSEFETALRLDSSYMKAYNNLGLTLEALGDTAEAIRNYNVAARLNQEQKLNSPWPYVYLSACFNRQERADDALTYAQKALAIDSRSDLAYIQMAKAYRFRGEWQKAAEAAQNAIAINSRTPDFYYLLSVALRKLGKTAESRQAMAAFQKLQEETARQQQKVRNRPQQRIPSAMPVDE